MAPTATDDPLTVLLDLLEVERVERNSFIGQTPEEGDRPVFGGQVAAQALRAAAATAEAEHHVNSLHAYFLRPGRHGVPITYEVDRIRDGASFTTRRVTALQNGEAILNLDASFHRDEPGDEHGPEPPVDKVDPPEAGEVPELPPWARLRPIEMRRVSPASSKARAMWVRAPGTLPTDDPSLHACVLTYLSDMGPVGVVAGWWDGRPREALMTASLDHCMWFHRRIRADEWMLYELERVASANARGVAWGSIWTSSGQLAVSLAQEALVRPLERRG
jgi:acyl-CoA thioesterase II